MVRKLAGLTTMILMALLLAACGSDDDNGDATEVATTVADIATEATTEEAVETETAALATVDVTEEVVTVAGESSPVATAILGGMASPASEALPPSAGGTPIGTPVATPVVGTPAASAAVAAAPISDDDADATPAAGEVALSGSVVLPGTANEAWVMTDDGCVGLGANAELHAGRQLVVRDAAGTIVGVTTLEKSDETDACSWTFSLSVPDSPFYAVSIPMVVEHVFTRQEIEQNGGEIVVPAA